MHFTKQGINNFYMALFDYLVLYYLPVVYGWEYSLSGLVKHFGSTSISSWLNCCLESLGVEYVSNISICKIVTNNY